VIWFAYFGTAVFLAYRVGRNHAGYGVALFIASVAVWQLANDGPGSFLENDGCARYSHIAQDC
jgi:hypothetical protein